MTTTPRAEEIRSTVRKFLFDTFYVSDGQVLTDATSLIEAGIIDSTGVLEIIGFLEATFQFHVEDEEIVPDNMDTIAHLVQYVDRKTA